MCQPLPVPVLCRLGVTASSGRVLGEGVHPVTGVTGSCMQWLVLPLIIMRLYKAHCGGPCCAATGLSLYCTCMSRPLCAGDYTMSLSG